MAFIIAPKRLWRALILFIGGCIVWYILGSTRLQDAASWQSTTMDARRMCEMYPDTGEIAVSLKTGATEAMKRLPAILESSLSCIKDVMVFSDLNQTYGDIKIHDVLSRFSPQAIKGNKDFDLYLDQLDLQAQGREDEIEALADIPAHVEDFHTDGHTAAWALDKYKFLHMLEMAWELQPDKDWYLFLEPDTYLSWPNLKRWLRTLDPSQRLYLGNSIRKSDDEEPYYFNHGGSAFIMSGSALREFAVDHNGIAGSLDSRLHEWWAGDMTVADALYDHMDLKATSAAPMFNQHSSRAFPFAERSWCEPAITLHHMQPDDFTEIFDIEKAFGFKRLLLRDVHDKIHASGFEAKRTDWDNLADAHEYALDGNAHVPTDTDNSVLLDPNTDLESCRIACEFNEECFQFTWRNTTIYDGSDSFRSLHSCVLASAFRLGAPKPPQEFRQNVGEKDTYRAWHSGWLNNRIEAWVKRHRRCPDGDHWVTFDPERPA